MYIYIVNMYAVCNMDNIFFIGRHFGYQLQSNTVICGVFRTMHPNMLILAALSQKERDIHSVCKNAPHETPQIPTCSKNKRGILTSFPFNDFSPTICQQCQFQSFSFLNSECIHERQKTINNIFTYGIFHIKHDKYNVHMCVYTNYPFLCSVLI